MVARRPHERKGRAALTAQHALSRLQHAARRDPRRTLRRRVVVDGVHAVRLLQRAVIRRLSDGLRGGGDVLQVRGGVHAEKLLVGGRSRG